MMSGRRERRRLAKCLIRGAGAAAFEMQLPETNQDLCRSSVCGASRQRGRHVTEQPFGGGVPAASLELTGVGRPIQVPRDIRIGRQSWRLRHRDGCCTVGASRFANDTGRRDAVGDPKGQQDVRPWRAGRGVQQRILRASGGSGEAVDEEQGPVGKVVRQRGS